MHFGKKLEATFLLDQLISVFLKHLVLISFLGSSSRAICRQNLSLPSTEVNAYWEWDSGGGTFLPYTVIASVDIETAYLKRSPSLDLSTSTSKLPYYIDFNKMTQRCHGYGTIRTIRRIQLMYSLQRYLQDLSKSSVLPSNSYTTPAASVLTSKKVSKSSAKTTPHSTSTKSRGTSSSSTSSSSSSSTHSAPVSSSTRGSTGRGSSAQMSGAVTRSKARKTGTTSTNSRMKASAGEGERRREGMEGGRKGGRDRQRQRRIIMISLFFR